MEETNTSYIGIKYSIHSLRIYIIYNHCSVLLQQPEMSGHFCKIPVLNYLWGMGSSDMMIKFTANHRRHTRWREKKIIPRCQIETGSQVTRNPPRKKKTNWIVVSNLLNILKYQSWMKPMNFMDVRWGNNFAKSPIPRLCNARCHGVHNVKKSGKPWQVDTSQ